MWKANKEYQKSFTDLLFHATALFIIGGVIGFIVETLYWHYGLGFCWFKTGFLRRMPFLPIYGFMLAIVYLLIDFIDYVVLKIEGAVSRFDKFGVPSFIGRTIFYFILFFVGSFIIELITGSFFYYVLDEVRLWDYRMEDYNINGFACPLYSALFGIAGALVLNTVYYPLDNLVVRIESNNRSKMVLRTISILFILAIFIDIPSSIDYWETGAYPWRGNYNC